MKWFLVFFSVLSLSHVSLANSPAICQMDAKVCPDGSSVGRQGSNCEFAACPSVQNKAEATLSVSVYTPMTLERIIDGDTFVASGKKIRLWGVDTPERKEPFYAEATKALELFLSNSELACQSIDVDRYQRQVMKCFASDADLGSLMVKAGWARDYKRYSKGFYQQEELFAKQSRLGIWKINPASE